MTNSQNRFDGQFQGENILLKVVACTPHYILDCIPGFLLKNFILILLCLGIYFKFGLLFSLLTFGILEICILAWIYHKAGHAQGYITSRRILQYIDLGFGKEGKKEVKIASINQISSLSDGIFGKFFNYGTIVINRSGDTIQFHGVKYYGEIDSYLSKIIDFQGKNGQTDELTPFIPRHIRKSSPSQE